MTLKIFLVLLVSDKCTVEEFEEEISLNKAADHISSVAL
jgi:hypothetical protein